MSGEGEKTPQSVEVGQKKSRRIFLKTAVGLGVTAAAGLYFGQGLFNPPGAPAPPSQPRTEAGAATGKVVSDRLDEFARNILPGGPPKDGIPPIDNPRFVTREQAAEFLSDDEVVFGLEYKGVVKAYPQIILVWHEIVNEVIAGEKLSITYCPLTGSAVAFQGRSKVDGKELTFGTSGSLVNSNLLMYDRQTDSNWPQVLGVAINGPNKESRLTQVPLAWTTWKRWREKHPDTLVLSPRTGFGRPYGQDPYGSYTKGIGYYYTEGTFFPVMARDRRFPSKKVVLGVQAGGSQLAIPKDEFRARRVDNVVVGGELVALFYDEELDALRAFSSKVDGRVLKFRLDGGRIVDDQTRSQWSPLGLSTRGSLSGTQLKAVDHFDVMWFAWYAFFPQSEVYV